MYYIGMMYQSNNQGVTVRVNGENTQYQAQTRIPLNTEAHIRFTYENGALTYSDGDETLTISDSNITPSTLLGLTIRSATVTNLKIYNI